MRFLTTLFFLSLPLYFFAQTLSMGKSSETHAVVIGVSDYQEDAIPDLRFAHQDAQAFVNYLQSEAGGALGEDQIMMLLNADATTASIAAALDWLIEQSGEGDKAYIYFSGHGDVETKTAMQHGFLLTYDSPSTTYIAGAFPLFYLQSVISTLSTQKQAEVIVITDACRSGNLAGSAVGGTQATTAALSKQFANETKIMSCQPDEFSLEGEQWGGGRGVFSYHLIEGMMGLADANGDLKVNLLEIGRYLEDKIPSEVAPESQIPMVLGNKGSRLSLVHEATLAELQAQKAGQSPRLATVDTKGLEDEILAKASPAVQQKYQAYKKALQEGHLLQPKTDCAQTHYTALQKEQSIAALHSLMTRRLAVAFQEEAQQAINAYLRADSTEMAQLYRQDDKYSRFPKYLSKAADLLGESHYMHPSLKAKEHYFSGLILRLQNDQQRSDSDLLRRALELQKQGLQFQDNAPFIYNEIGILHSKLGDKTQAAIAFKEAIKLAPYWLVPQSQLIKTYIALQRYQEAIRYGEKTQVIKQDFPEVSPTILREILTELGLAYTYEKEYEKAEAQFKSLLTEDRLHLPALVSLGWIMWARSRWDEAQAYLEQAIAIAPEDAEALTMLGDVYFFTGAFAQSEQAYQKVLEKHPDDVLAVAKIGFLYLHWNKTPLANQELVKAKKLVGPDPNLDVVQAFIYRNNKRYPEALQLIEKIIQEKKVAPRIMPQTLTLLGYILQDIGQYSQAEQVYLKTHQLGEEHYWPMYCLARLYAQQKKTELAMGWLQKSLEHGGPWEERITKDLYLKKLRKEKGYAALLQTHFGENTSH